jgi:hypothetical protein
MGGELIITDENNNKIEVTPEFGNFAILDFQNYNLKHEVKKSSNTQSIWAAVIPATPSVHEL